MKRPTPPPKSEVSQGKGEASPLPRRPRCKACGGELGIDGIVAGLEDSAACQQEYNQLDDSSDTSRDDVSADQNHDMQFGTFNIYDSPRELQPGICFWWVLFQT